jgi:hypothetical protein
LGDTLKIDPDLVEQTASTLKDVAEEHQQAGTALMDTTADLLSPISAADFAFRQGLAEATAFWSRRVSGLTTRLVDGAEFMETNAAMAREVDAEAGAEFVSLENAVGAGEYTKQQYYEATGAQPPSDSFTGDRTAVPVNGESVAV